MPDRTALLWTIIVLAIALRLLGVLLHPVDQDELYTVMEATDLYATKLAPGIQSRPLYYFVQHALFWIMPANEPYTRLLPLLAGGVGVWLVARLATRVATRDAAIVAALAAACSPWHAYASETARYYSTIFALVTATLLLVIEARERDTVKAWAIASIPVVIGLLVHPAYVLATVAVLAWAMLRGSMSAPRWSWPSRARWLGFVLPVVIGGALLLLSIVLAKHPGGVANGGARMAGANVRLVPAMVEWATPILVLAGVAGLLVALRRKDESDNDRMTGAPSAAFTREAAWMLGITTASTLALVTAASVVTAAYADYAIGMLPGLFVGAGMLAAWAAPRGRAWAVALLLVAGMAPSLASHVIDGTRFDYRPAFDTIRQLGKDKLVLIWPVAIGAHYAPELRREALDAPPRKLNALLAREHELWAVVSYKRFGLATDGGAPLRDWLRAHCIEQEEYERPRFDDRVYRVSLQRCSDAPVAP